VIIGVPKETFPGERRVALVPASLQLLAKQSIEVIIEAGAGSAAGYPDAAYSDKGGKVVPRAEVFGKADVVAMVRAGGANPKGDADLASLRDGQVLVAFLDPLGTPAGAEKIAARKVQAYAMELIPRTTRAQSMDALSSMANLAGYKAVLMAANHAPRIFPMMTTAAGTITAAKVLVLGVGVAGLQAIATARRLGAVVEAFDIRPETREQVESLGARFVALDLGTENAQTAGGYARELTEDEKKKQSDLMADHVRAADVVVTTAQVPGRKAPRLIHADVVRGMKPGAVIVDMAAESGGNCELTVAGEEVDEGGVIVLGPRNLPGTVAASTSMLYSNNLTSLLGLLVKEGELVLDREDEIIAGALVCHGGEVTSARVKELLG
jgi:NAD(P) transhydrogenase subunit alpha